MMSMTGGQPTYDDKKLAIAQDAVNPAPVVDGKKAEPDEERKQLVQEVIQWVTDAKLHFDDDFKQMRWCQDFARGKQWDKQKTFDSEDRIIVNIVQRHIRLVVSKLYAKNPTPVCKQAEQMDYKVWDGTPESLTAALNTLKAAQAVNQGAMISPDMAGAVVPALQQAQSLLADVQQGLALRGLRTRLGKTLELLCKYYLRVQKPDFKRQMKQLVRRAATTKVGYIKLGFQRALQGMLGDMQTRLADANQQISYLENLKTAILDPDQAKACDSRLEEYRLVVQDVQKQANLVLQEGVVIDFPLAQNIIPDPACTALDTWAGATRIAEQFLLLPSEVQRRYGVDITGKFKAYTKDGKESKTSASQGKTKKKALDYACVWEVYDQDAGLVYPVCHGFEDFLKEPAGPDVKLSTFFPIFALVPNQVDHDEKLFPQSDVELIAPSQKEINKKKQAARQHRFANRPLYGAPKGSMGKEDKHNMAVHEDHEVIFFEGLERGQDINTLISSLKKVPMETALYETQSDMQDIEMMAGAQESDFGPTSDATATEVTNAAAQRQSVVASNTDDVDDFLSGVFKGMGEIAMRELSPETVQKIVGPGAIWSQFTEQQIFEDIWLETKGGSSGRPNSAQDAAKLQQLVPLLVQVPGVSPAWLAQQLIEVLDDGVDLEQAFTQGLPSIVAQNALAQPSTGDAATDPAQQGGKGGQNAPNADESRGAPQGMHPAGVAMQ